MNKLILNNSVNSAFKTNKPQSTGVISKAGKITKSVISRNLNPKTTAPYSDNQIRVEADPFDTDSVVEMHKEEYSDAEKKIQQQVHAVLLKRFRSAKNGNLQSQTKAPLQKLPLTVNKSSNNQWRRRQPYEKGAVWKMGLPTDGIANMILGRLVEDSETGEFETTSPLEQARKRAPLGLKSVKPRIPDISKAKWVDIYNDMLRVAIDWYARFRTKHEDVTLEGSKFERAGNKCKVVKLNQVVCNDAEFSWMYSMPKYVHQDSEDKDDYHLVLVSCIPEHNEKPTLWDLIRVAWEMRVHKKDVADLMICTPCNEDVSQGFMTTVHRFTRDNGYGFLMAAVSPIMTSLAIGIETNDISKIPPNYAELLQRPKNQRGNLDSTTRIRLSDLESIYWTSNVIMQDMIVVEELDEEDKQMEQLQELCFETFQVRDFSELQLSPRETMGNDIYEE